MFLNFFNKQKKILNTSKLMLKNFSPAEQFEKLKHVEGDFSQSDVTKFVPAEIGLVGNNF